MSRVAVLLVVVLVGCRAVGQQVVKDPPKSKADAGEVKLSDDEQAVVEATNAERKKAGLDPLTVDAKLLEAARGHAANMARQDVMKHDLDGKTAADRVKAVGYKFGRMGENIAKGQPKPADVLASWMKSQGHKENILNKEFTQIGVAVAKNEKGEPYWVQVFGTPLGK